MTISVVIPAYNEERYIAGCIESVLEHAPAELKDIIVVCNACTDRTAEIAARYPRVRVVHEPRKGTGYSRHRGFEESTGDILAYVDADSRIHDQWFPQVKREFSDDPNLASLSGPCRFYDIPAWQSAVVYMWWMALAVPEYYRSRFCILGGNFAVRRSALEAIGGFDLSIPFWGDDTNLARRLKDVGTVKFTLEFYNYSSARRLKHDGFIKVGTTYAINYFSQAYLEKSVTLRPGDRPWERVTPSRRRLLSPSQWSSLAKNTVRKVARKATESRA